MQYLVAIMHDPLSQTTNCLCVGLKDEEISYLLKYLQAVGLGAQNPLMVPVILATLSCIPLQHNVVWLDTNLWSLQKETGLHSDKNLSRPKDIE